MRVRRVSVDAYAIPFRRPFVTSCRTITERRGFVVRLEGEDGTIGVGEAAPHPLDPEAAAPGGAEAVRAAAAGLIGADTQSLAGLLEGVASMPAWIASGVDMALHDLAARALGRAVTELLGGSRPAAVRASALVDGDDDGACARAAVAAARAGYRTVKLKIGGDVVAARARLQALRAAMPWLAVRADVNGGWDETTALGACAALACLGLEWIEQPLPPGEGAALTRLRRACALPIAADEAVTGAGAVRELAALGAVDAVVLKLVQVGGLARALEAARAAAAADLAIAVTTSFDTSIGGAAALHLACAVPGRLRDCGLATASLLAGDLVRRPLAEGPVMLLPRGPGLGVELSPGALERWRAR